MISSWKEALAVARNLENHGDDENIEKAYLEALSCAKAIFHEHPECLIETLDLICRYYEDQKRYNSLELLYRNSLDFIESRKGDHSKLSNSIRKKYSLYHISRGNFEEAQTIAENGNKKNDQSSSKQDPFFDTHNFRRSFTETPHGNQDDPDKPSSPVKDEINCTVYSASEIHPGDPLFVQVFAHLPTKGDEVADMALQFDQEALPRGTTSLESTVKQGSIIGFHLETDSKVAIDEPFKKLRWVGLTDAVQFCITFPDTHRPGGFVGKIVVTYEGVPMGHILFKIKVLEPTTSIFKNFTSSLMGVKAFFSKSRKLKKWTPSHPQGHLKPYKYAFISYASQDRNEVLRRVQMLGLTGIKYFQDILCLDPGVRWEKELYRHIDRSDVFFLFWSASAQKSKWVLREVKHALSCQKSAVDGFPKIIPVILEGPPIPEPPIELSHIHFNDCMVYFMQ